MVSINNATTPAPDAVPVGHIPSHEKFTVDLVIDRLWDLYHLIDSVSVTLCERDFRRKDGSRDREMDRMSSLVSIARTRTRELHNDLVDRYNEIDDALGDPAERAAA